MASSRVACWEARKDTVELICSCCSCSCREPMLLPLCSKLLLLLLPIRVALLPAPLLRGEEGALELRLAEEA